MSWFFRLIYCSRGWHRPHSAPYQLRTAVVKALECKDCGEGLP